MMWLLIWPISWVALLLLYWVDRWERKIEVEKMLRRVGFNPERIR